MNKLFLLIVILFTAIGMHQVKAQIPDDTDGRLYHLCKTWGYFKYFNQHKCDVKWDTLLNTTINEVLLANSNTQFNNALMNMFNKVGNNSNPANPGTEPDTNINFNNSWIDDPAFSQPVMDYLDTFSIYIYPDTSTCLVKFNDYQSPGYYGWIDFRDDSLSMPIDYSNEANRLTTMFYYWNVINYFFPYRNIMDQPWDSTLYQFIPLIREATSVIDFHSTFLKLVTRINDTHGGVTSSSVLTNSFWGGNKMPFIYFTRVDSLCVVSKVQNIPGVSPGDILTHLKGIPIQEIEDSLVFYIPASTPAALYNDMYYKMLQGELMTTLNFTFLDSNNSTYTTAATRLLYISNWFGWRWDNGLTSSYFITSCGYGYVNMGMLEPTEVFGMYNALKDTPTIIFDIRNYPNGTLWDIGPLLFPGPIISTITYDPALTYDSLNHYYLPGWYYQDNDYNFLGTWSNPDAYSGNVYILVNQETLSQAEYTCQYFSFHPNSKVFGTQTSGVDGNISYLTLPGGITTYFTSLGWYYADGYQQQRNGVKIDTVVSPTVAGIRQGTDEILEAAFDCLVGIDHISKAVANISVYPNPVSDNSLYIDITLENSTEISCSLFNMTGTMIRQQSMHITQGSNMLLFKIPGVTPGIYLLKVQYGNEIMNTKVVVN